MKKTFKIFFLFLLFGTLTSVALHKFYVSVNQIDFIPKKKALEITSRIFIDDIDLALEKKYGKKFYLGTSKETSESLDFLKKYLKEKFSIKVNGHQKEIIFLGKEIEDNVLICYLTIKDIEKVNSLEIKNTILMELYDQQHIFHTNILGNKKSILLTSSETQGLLKY